MKVQFKKIDPRMGTEDRFALPSYGSAGAGGLDLRAMVEEPITLMPGEVRLLPTGVAILLDDPGYAALLLPRSGLGHKHGIVLGNLVGLVDSDYQGQVFLSCWNRSITPFPINPGDRIAQMVVVPVLQVKLEEVQDFKSSQRGAGGFGSTGKS